MHILERLPILRAAYLASDFCTDFSSLKMPIRMVGMAAASYPGLALESIVVLCQSHATHFSIIVQARVILSSLRCRM